MKLFYHPVSGTSFKVRSVLLEVGASCEMITVDLAKGEHKAPPFLALNPNGKIPVLDDDGLVIWESNAIILYLGMKFPEKGLIPTDPRANALMHQWLHWHGAMFYPSMFKAQWETYYPRFFGHTKNEAKLAEGIAETKGNLAVLNKGLEGKEYLAGKLSVADFSIVSHLHVHEIVGLNLSEFPNVKRWLGLMEQRESVRKAMPPM